MGVDTIDLELHPIWLAPGVGREGGATGITCDVTAQANAIANTDATAIINVTGRSLAIAITDGASITDRAFITDVITRTDVKVIVTVTVITDETATTEEPAANGEQRRGNEVVRNFHTMQDLDSSNCKGCEV